MEEISLDYWAGFIDGEGCFMLYKLFDNRYKHYYYQFIIAIKLRDDDLDILNKCKKQLGGNIYKYTYKIKETGKISHGCYWNIQNKKSIDNFIQLMDGRLHAKKAKDFELFKDAFYYYRNHKNKTDPIFIKKMEEYCSNLKSIKKYNECQVKILSDDFPIDKWIDQGQRKEVRL